MGAPVQVWTAPVRAFPFVLTSGQVEVLKWLGLAAMLIAHAAEYLWGVKSGWPINVGQLAFPLFVAALAYSLVGDVRGRSERLVWRLLPYALVAQVFAVTMRDGVYLNVLFQFMAAAAWLRAGTEPSAWTRWGLRVCAVVVAGLSEFAVFGLLLIVGAVRFWQWERYAYWWAMVVPALAGIALMNGGPYFFLAVPLVVMASMWRGLEVRRVRGVFARIYAGQFPAFWIVRAWL